MHQQLLGKLESQNKTDEKIDRKRGKNDPSLDYNEINLLKSPGLRSLKPELEEGGYYWIISIPSELV